MRGSLSLPLSFLWVKYLVDINALASTQKGATAGWILQDAEQTSQEPGQGGSFRVVWTRGKESGCIHAVSGYDRWHPNQRNKPKPSTTSKGRQGAGKWQVSSRPDANRNRSITRAGWKQSAEDPEQWLRTQLLPPPLAFIFQGHKDMGSGQMRWEHASTALRPACPHAPVTLPTRIPQYSRNLGHCSFSKMFTRDSSNGQSLQCATFPRELRNADCHDASSLKDFWIKHQQIFLSKARL